MSRVTGPDVLAIEPELRSTAAGGWLAVSPAGAPLRIGVEGGSEDEARSRFAESLQAWARLRAIPDYESPGSHPAEGYVS